MNKTHRLTRLAILTALAIILSYVEYLLPPIYPAIPGIKLGLANIISILLIYRYTIKDTVLVTLARVLTVALIFGNFMTLAYSIAGAALSITVMTLLKKTGLFSAVGVSIAGGVFHNVGQILVAIIITATAEIGYYLIFLCVSGIIAGIIIGILGMLVLKYTDRIKGTKL